MTTTTTTTVLIRDLPRGLRAAVAHLMPKGRDVVITAQAMAVPSTYTNLSRYNANALVLDLDVAQTVEYRTGVWGGDNGFNRAPEDRAWDPVFDREARDVPLGGAIVVGQRGGSCQIYVHPTTFAERYMSHPVVRDAFLETTVDVDVAEILATEAPLTDEECAILYAHSAYKSGEYRKRVVQRFASALESCVAMGLIKRSSNGACSITTPGKARSAMWRKRGEDLAYKTY